MINQDARTSPDITSPAALRRRPAVTSLPSNEIGTDELDPIAGAVGASQWTVALPGVASTADQPLDKARAVRKLIEHLKSEA